MIERAFHSGDLAPVDPEKVSPRRDYTLLAGVALVASLTSFIYFFRRGEVLLYGDAVAHINIARRVFDSRTPGFQQLGTVWLPLPHLLMMPFLVSNWMWRTGVGGSLASMASYILGGLGIARLFWKGSIAPSESADGHARRLGGWLAALFYLLNPNLVYIQTTAMTEPLSMALAIWAIVFYAEFQLDLEAAGATPESERAATVSLGARSVRNCGMVIAAGMLTRYDNWFLAVVIGSLLLWSIHRARPGLNVSEKAISGAAKRFFALVALVPLLWLGYNFGTYGNALEFATGPYSARAIAQRSAQNGVMYPGYHDLSVAITYFFKCAKLNLCQGVLVAPALLAAIVGAGVLILWRRRSLAALLWLPLAFYALSMAYGGVPIFMPVWWPFSYYNVRYGLQLLPIFSVSAGLAAMLLWRSSSRVREASLTIVIVLFAAMYGTAVHQTPITLREARVNAVTRMAFESKLAVFLKSLPPGSTLLMYTGDHVGALQQASVPLKRVITENNYHLWQSALEHPAQSAEYVVAVNGDPVWQAAQVHGEQLQAIASFLVPGQPAATVYKSSASPR